MIKILNIAVDAMGGEGSPEKTIEGIIHHSKLTKNVNYNIFGNEKAIFPYKYPALFSVTTAFIFTWFFSKIDKSKKSQKEINKFDNQLLRSQIGMK